MQDACVTTDLFQRAEIVKTVVGASLNIIIIINIIIIMITSMFSAASNIPVDSTTCCVTLNNDQL